jgi:DNA repair protein RadC
MDQPRERLIRFGAAGLTDVELVAILLGTGAAGRSATGLAREILDRIPGMQALARTSPSELQRVPGVGQAKASRLAAAFEVGARALAPSELTAPLGNSRAVFLRYGPQLMHSLVERFVVVSVDSKNRPRHQHEIARGGRAHCQVDPAEVFRTLIAHSASGAIFLHNHPSGDTAPSAEDLALTERLVAAGALLEVRILDHLIVGGGRYTSLRDAGFWPHNQAKSIC